MEEEKLNNLIYLLRIHHIDSEPLENLIKRNKELEEECKYLKEQIPVDKIFYYFYKDFIPKSKVREKIEERYGTLCMELGSYVRDEATPEQERIAGGINELRKLKNELLQEGDK